MTGPDLAPGQQAALEWNAGQLLFNCAMNMLSMTKFYAAFRVTSIMQKRDCVGAELNNGFAW
jgi:hypothetical protein